MDRQIQIYERLAAKGFATTNIVLGIGSYTYQMNTRDTLGFAAKGAWFEVEENGTKVGYDIYKDPITDDGTKKSLKGLIRVDEVSVTSEETGITYTKYEVKTIVPTFDYNHNLRHFRLYISKSQVQKWES